MPRSSKDSDDEEPRAGRIQTRMFAAHPAVNSPLRRSNRIKHTMESSTEILKATRYTRGTSFSSDINEISDGDVGTSRRITRRSAVTTFSPSARITRTLSKRLTRAGSETKSSSILSPLRTTCRTRASSADVESASVQSCDQSDISIKLHKQVTTLPSCSSFKEDSEEIKPLIHLDDVIFETEEYTNTENSDSSLDKMLHINKDKKDKKESFDTEQCNPEECLLHDAIIIDEDTTDKFSSSLKKKKNDNVDNKISGLSEVQISLIDIHKKEKELEVKMENILNTFIEEKKRSPNNNNNKENQTLNIISSISIEKSTQPITSLPSLSTDSLTSSANINKTLNDKENKLDLSEISLDDKWFYLEESTETAKHGVLLQDIDSNKEKIDISKNSSLNPTRNKSDLDNSLRSDINEKQSSMHDSKSSIDNTNKLLLLEDNSIEVNDETIIAKEMSIENKSGVFEDTIVEASNKLDKNKDSKKSGVTETSKISDLSINQISDKRDSMESLDLIQTLDNNAKAVQERRPCSNKNEVSSIIDQFIINYTKQLSNNAEILLSNDKNSHDNQSTVMQSIVSQDDISDNNFFKEKQKTLREQTDHSYAVSEILNLSSKELNPDNTIQDNQSLDIPKTFEKSVTEIAKDNLDVSSGIELFQDVPAEKWKKKIAERNDEPGPNFQLTEKLETQTDCDLVLVDKQTWFEAKNIEEAKEQELLEYDSDDTIILKDRLEAAKANFSDTKRLTISNQETDLDSEKTKTIKLNKKRKLLTKRKSASPKDKNSSSEREEEEYSLSVSNKSSKQLETAALKRCKDQIAPKLIKSDQVNTTEQISRMYDTLNKEMGDDADKLHRNLPMIKKNIALRKSAEKRESLNKSVKNTSLNQSNVQEVCINQSQIDTSKKDNIGAHIKKKAKTKRSLNESNNIDEHNKTITEKENKGNIEDEDTFTNCLVTSKSPDINKISIDSNNKINDNVNIICAMDLEVKNNSTLAVAELLSDTDSLNRNKNVIPQFLFTPNNEDDSKDDNSVSIDLDIKQEYNLSGVKQMFSDDVPVDECRDSEVEFSDPDDHGSDLVDFIVDDDNDYMESEKMEEDNKDVEEKKTDFENKDEQYIIEDNKVKKKKADDQQACKTIEHCTESDNEEDVNKENDEVDVYKNNSVEIEIIDNITEGSKINKKKKSKRKAIEIISSSSESKTKRYVEATKSPVNKTEETILLDISTLTSSFKQKKNLDPQCSLKSEAETLTKQTNTSAIESKKFMRSPVAILGCSTPKFTLQSKKSQTVIPEFQSNFNSNNVEINKRVTFLNMGTDDQNMKKDVEEKYIKLDKTNKSMQNTSVKKKKSIKISVLKRDINLEKLNCINSNKEMLNANFANDVIQESNQQKQRKRKRQKEEMWDEDATDELVLKDTKELSIPKKKRRVIVDSMSNTTNKICEYTCGKKKKKNQNYKDEKVNKNDILQESIYRNKIELIERNKKNKPDRIANAWETKSSKDNYTLIKKQIICQETGENKEILPKQLSEKKKKEETTLLLQTRVLRLKSDNLESDKVRLQNAELKSISSKMQNKEDFSMDNYKILKKKIKCQKIAEKKEILSEELSEKKKKKKDNASQLGIMKLKSDTLKSDKYAVLKLADSTEPQDEETNSSMNNYTAIKKKHRERKIVNKEALSKKSLKKKKKSKKISPLEIGTPMLKEQEAADSKGTSAEKLLKKKKRAKQILLESGILTVKSDNFQSNKLQSQKYKSELAVSLKAQDEKKNSSTVSYKGMHKKIKRQKTIESREYCLGKLSEKKKKKEETSTLKSKTPKVKSDKLQSHNIMSHIDESRSTFETQNKALKDIHTTEIHRTVNEELNKKKKKRKLEDSETNTNKNEKMSVKKKKKERKIKEKNCLSSSIETLKQLSDNVIVNFASMPKKKKRKMSRNEDQLTSKNIGKSMTATSEDSIPSSSCSNCISQFTVVSLEKTKKQQSLKGVTEVISARQHISTENREPVSAYISYLQKQRAASKIKFTNAF